MRRKPLVILFLTVILLMSAIVVTNVNAVKARRAKATIEEITLPSEAFNNYVLKLYNDVGLGSQGLKKEVFRKAMIGYFNLKHEGKFDEKRDILTVVDFTIKSTDKRMWVIDLRRKEVIYKTVVSHGKNSGGNYAVKFSNTPNSYMSSIGFYVTSEKYCGKHGNSLRLDGMDEGFNDNARRRAIVIHGADYTSPGTAKALGRLGRSFGCPAIPTTISDKLINKIANNTCLFIYYPDRKYEASTKYYNLNNAVKAYSYEVQLGLLK